MLVSEFLADAGNEECAEVYCTLPIQSNQFMAGETVKLTRSSLYHILARHVQGKNPNGEEITSRWDPCLDKIDHLLTILRCTLMFGEVCMPKEKTTYIRVSRHYPHVIGWDENDWYNHRAVVWVDLHTTLLQTFRPDSCRKNGQQPECNSPHHHRSGGLPPKGCFRTHFPTNAKEAAKSNDRKMWQGCPHCNLPVHGTPI